MSTWTNLRVLPLIAAVAFAAGCPKDESDDPKDDSPGDDTAEETGDDTDDETPGPRAFLPTQLAYQAAFGVDADGNIAPYTVAGSSSSTPIAPFFVITLSDDRDDSCVLIYEVKPEAWGHVGQTADTDATGDGPEDLLEWLDDNDLFFGWRIGPDDYEPLFLNDPDSRCADLPEEVLANPHAAFFDLNWEGGAHGVGFIGFDTTVDASLVQAYEGTGITANQILGGRLGFPFMFGEPPDQSNFFEITATWGLTDEGEVTLDQQFGLPSPAQPAADAWDGEQPSEGFYSMFSPSVLTIRWQ